MSSTEVIGWERALMAAEKVKERLRRATKALEQAGVPYAVAGGNAVAEWVGRVDDGAVRNTKDVDLLVRRADFAAVQQTLESVGFIYNPMSGGETFIDGPDGKPSAGVHLLFAGEMVRAADDLPSPDLDDSEVAADFRVLSLPALIQMKLLAWRDRDRVHLQDLIGVGLIDASWPARLPSTLAERLQELLDHPEG